MTSGRSRSLCQALQKAVEEGADNGAGFSESQWALSRRAGGMALKTNDITPFTS